MLQVWVTGSGGPNATLVPQAVYEARVERWPAVTSADRDALAVRRQLQDARAVCESPTGTAPAGRVEGPGSASLPNPAWGPLAGLTPWRRGMDQSGVRRLALGQRIVVVVALGFVLAVFGTYVTSLGTSPQLSPSAIRFDASQGCRTDRQQPRGRRQIA